MQFATTLGDLLSYHLGLNAHCHSTRTANQLANSFPLHVTL